MNKAIDNLIHKLKDLYQERLSSIILYGSCATEENKECRSDINLMVIMDKLSSADLETAHNPIKHWIKTKNPLPIFMDKEEWFNSSDIYPIEYSDIKERYKILYGEDIVNSLIIEDKNLRLQCELEIKNLLIKLRQVYIAKSSDSKVLKNLIKTSSKRFLALFRAVLRLSSTSVPFKHEEVINLLASQVEIDKELFLKILSFRDNSRIFNDKEYKGIVKKLIDSTDRILKYVDKLEKQEV